jgi:condensin complex subunit 1
VRANLVIALGDLSFRFPNLIEPWTSHIYARLRDVDVQVRKNTMLVLSHLILNDMIKVKGQISEIAISIVDEDETIRNSARLFFHELSLRGNNPIYNLLPDAIGRLSLTETLEQKDFESICKLLVSFISKEKQIESIVEKLSQRLSNCPSASEGGAKQQRDLAFCLSLLPHTEKSLRFIVLHRKFFMDALHDEVVQTHFQQIIQKVK